MSKFKAYLFILLATSLAYATSLKYGFSQDDWYFLLISRATNLSEVINFFNPLAQSGFAFFRPLGTQLYYFLFTSVFGLTFAPLFMHIFMLLLQASNGYLVYRLAQKLRLPPLSAFLVGLAYATHSAQFLSLFYIAATQQLLAAFFGLYSLNHFLDRRRFLSILFFILALLSKETAIVIPAVAFILYALTHPILKVKPLIINFSPYFLLSLVYLLVRYLLPHTIQSEYHFAFGLNVVSTLRWYLLFAFGAAEEWLRYTTYPFGINLLQFIHDFGILGFSVVVFTLATFSLFILASFRSFSRRTLLYLAWFVLALAPVLLLANHRYPHYLDLALIPLLLILYRYYHGKWQYVVTILILLGSISNIWLSERLHWTTNRSQMAASAQSTLDWSSICTHSSVVFTGPDPLPRELSYTLSLANGPQVICQNSLQSVYYQGVDPVVDPAAFPIDISSVFK